MKEQPTKWATAVHQERIAALVLSRASRARLSCASLSWGSASLHPRLYASTRYAGFETGPALSLIFLWSVALNESQTEV
jgi:hypothetical protein